jgi:beta-xylosidase
VLHNVPMFKSLDLINWTYQGDAFPTLPSWASSGWTWAPEVLQVGGQFVLYFTIRATGVNRQCIGRAMSASPLGPFVDNGQLPLICEDTEGGSIDASPFRDDDGSLYLYWKNDGNAIGIPTNLYGQPLTADGLSMAGERVTLLTNNPSSWHGHVIEAPQVHKNDGRYYLFYSANAFDGPAYAVGYAELDTPLGAAHDAPENPILSTVEGAEGPGHCSVVRWTDNSTWMLYHAWNADHSARTMWLDRVEWVDGRPDVQGPTTGPQPIPGA